jgi:hypothetical protein
MGTVIGARMLPPRDPLPAGVDTIEILDQFVERLLDRLPASELADVCAAAAFHKRVDGLPARYQQEAAAKLSAAMDVLLDDHPELAGDWLTCLNKLRGVTR